MDSDGGHESAVSLLITLGANVNKTFGSSCSTPAHLAAKNGHVSVLKILGKAGADFAARNKSGDTFFLQVSRSDVLARITVMELRFCAHISWGSWCDDACRSCVQACAAGQEEVVHWVLGLEAGLRKLLHESCGGFGTSPLMAAAAGGHLGVLRILLAGDEGKASVCLTDSAGNTALHMAARGSSCVQVWCLSM